MIQAASISRHSFRQRYADLDDAGSYEAWAAAAEALDAETGAAAWRDRDESELYDAEALRDSILAMQRHRADGDAAGLADQLTEDLYRHLNDLLAPDLYSVALGGTKRLVERFLGEAESSLLWLAQAPGIPHGQLLTRFEQAWHVFGRTALLLSGGATWGFHHLGVVKALFELELLPHILSGASTGAMMAAGVCSRDRAGLEDLFANPEQLRLDGLAPVGPVRAWRQGALLDPARLEAVLLHNVGDLTFAEAHARSGRSLAISVSPTRHRQKARLLSHLTAPDVRITSAVLASSALPTLFPPVELTRRGPDGQVAPYVPGERWVDGSIAGDLPKRRLSRLHNVNHFVVSQTNPHALPFVRHHGRRGVGPALMRVVSVTARSQGQWATELVRRVSGAGKPIGRLAAAANAVFTQDYRGHVDLHPRFRPHLLARIVRNPTVGDLHDFIREGERAVWPRVAMIREQTRIGRAFRRAVALLRAEAPAGPGAPPAPGASPPTPP